MPSPGFGKEKAQKEIIAPAMIIEENLDVPTVLRRGFDRGSELKSNEIRRLGKLGGYNVDDEDLYDTPTFLRKQAD